MNDPTRAPQRVQVAIIGAGPGGSVAATTLAEAGHDVLLIEAGPHLPVDSAPHFSRDEMMQKYCNGGITPSFALSTSMAYLEGCCVGGGSEINRGLYQRTPDTVVETWRRDFHVDGITCETMVPHFEACEAVARVSPLRAPAPPSSLRLQEGANRLGWRCAEVPRLVTYDDNPSGKKQSMSATFLPRFLAAGGGLMPDTRVHRLRRIGGRWSISGTRRGRTLDIEADTIFVAGGAIRTPALLKRSGIRRHVGGSLRFHPMVKVVAQFPEEINLPGMPDPVHSVKEFEPRFSMGCSISAPPLLALTMAEHPDHMTEVDRHWRHMALYYVQSTGGIGSVHNVPGFRDPLVRVQFSRSDMAELAEGLKRLCECLFAAGAVTIYPGISGGVVLRTTGGVRGLPDTLRGNRATLSALHLFATCPMGERGDRCAVDSFGKVHGVDDLYLADASLLPSPTVVNPQGSVMAIAHRNALHFLERAAHGAAKPRSSDGRTLIARSNL